MRHRFAFVLEQTLGHVAHARNIERALALEPDIDGTIIRLENEPSRGLSSWPGVGTWSFRASWAARRALLERLRSGRLDAVFIHTQVASLLAADLMRVVPTVVSLDATPVNFVDLGAAYGHRRQAKLVETVKRRINRVAFDSARILVTWCRWAAESLERDYGVPAGKTRVVHPGVDLDLFKPATEPSSSGALRLLFVGGNFERKGGYDLLEAVRGFDADTIELDIVTGDRVDADTHIPCRTHYGLRPQSSELVDLYRRADVLVLPTRGDCFPQVIAEALACRLPIVAANVGGIPEMVRPGVNGWLVSPGSPRDLARALESVVADPGLRHRFGDASLALARAQHDAFRNNRSLFEAMANLAGAPARSAVA